MNIRLVSQNRRETEVYSYNVTSDYSKIVYMRSINERGLL